MLRIDIPDFEIPAPTERTIQTILASRAIPGGQPSDKFLYEPLARYQLTVWADSLMEAGRSIYRFAVGEERKRANRLHGIANLDQALRLVKVAVAADSNIPPTEKEQETMRRVYRLGEARAAMQKRMIDETAAK